MDSGKYLNILNYVLEFFLEYIDISNLWIFIIFFLLVMW